MKKFFCITFFTLLTLSSVAHERRLALIIGNSKYLDINDRLPNTGKDADSMNTALKKCDFTTILTKDLDRRRLWQEIQSFAIKMKDYDIGLIFYAGHGFNFNGDNYFVPTDLELGSNNISAKIAEKIASENCVSLQKIQEILFEVSENNKRFIIISDACRNNPFSSLYMSIDNDNVWTKTHKELIPTSIKGE